MEKHLLFRQKQLFPKIIHNLLRRLCRHLQADGRQLAALFQKFAHDFAVIHIMVEHTLVHRDVGVARHAEHAAGSNAHLAERKLCKMKHKLIRQGKFHAALLAGNEHHFLKLACQRHKAKQGRGAFLFMQRGAHIAFPAAQKRKRVPAVDNLR